MDKQEIIGVGILSVLSIAMIWALVSFDFGKTGKAIGDLVICNNDTICNENETIENCPEDCAQFCGNNIIETYILYTKTYPNTTQENVTYDEACDMQDLDGNSCESLGYSGGNLSCYSNCSFNISSCFICGDNICNGNETNETCSIDCGCMPNTTRNYGLDTGECQYGIEICYNGTWHVQVPTLGPLNETCNSLDDDCDGSIDEGFDWNNNSVIDDNETFDYDEDEYFPKKTVYHNLNCTGYDDDEYDCNDKNSSIHPGAREKLNDIDDDCDGSIDENITEFNQSSSIERIDLGFLKKEGSNLYLRVGDFATFKIGDLFGQLEIKSISASETIVIVSIVKNLDITNLPDASMALGDVKEFDLNNDGRNDVSIQLYNIQSGFKAYLKIKEIWELFSPLPCNSNGACDSGETAASCPGDCLVINYCNSNGICDGKETLQSCPNDCIIRQVVQPIAEEQPKIIQEQILTPTCNNNSVCDAEETKETCPMDCKFDFSKYMKYLIPAVIGVLMLLTLTTTTVVIKKKSNPYKINSVIKQNLLKALALGYDLGEISRYLLGQKLDEKTVKSGLRYSSDFITLKRAIAFYLAQGRSEDYIRKICYDNKWSKNITDDVFENIYTQQRKAINTKKPVSIINRENKYQIKGF